MSNEELAVIIQAGERAHILTLWEQVRRFTYRQSRRWYLALGNRAGMDLEDFHHVAFLALLDALEGWDAGAGSFLTWYGLRLKSAFAEATGQRTQKAKRDPLQAAISLDAPLTDTEGDPLALEDVIADAQAEADLEAVESREQRVALAKALDALQAEQRQVVILRYCQGLTVEQTAARLHMTRQEARRTEQSALRALRHPRVSRLLR